MRSACSLLGGVAAALAVAQPPPGYYNAAQGLSGQALRQALHGIISNHTVLPNSALWGAFTTTDDRPDGGVWDIYSDVPGGTPAYIYQFGTDQCGNYDSEGDCYNREHSFPQSWYGSAAPMSTDLFHIYPTDAWVNQVRANWPFGTVPAPTWTSTNGGKLGPCGWPGCPGTAFEPIDAYKGDLARSFFYMMTRYLPQLGGWNSPMMTGSDLSPWAASLLLAWHSADPVSVKEIDRNNAVFALQQNRNPFIDEPSWAGAIWGPDASIADEGPSPMRVWVQGDRLWIDGAPPGLASVTVMDASGREVISATWPQEALPLPQGLPSGVYTLVGVSSALRIHARFVR